MSHETMLVLVEMKPDGEMQVKFTVFPSLSTGSRRMVENQSYNTSSV